MHYLRLQLCLRKKCSFRAFSKCYWSKAEENMGEESQKSQRKKAAGQREKRKKKPALRMFRNSLGSFGRFVFSSVLSCFYLPSANFQVQEQPGLRTAQSQLWRMELISQTGIRFMFCSLNHSRSCCKSVSTGPCPSTQSCDFWTWEQGRQQNVGADFYWKKGFKLEGSSFSEKKNSPGSWQGEH